MIIKMHNIVTLAVSVKLVFQNTRVGVLKRKDEHKKLRCGFLHS